MGLLNGIENFYCVEWIVALMGVLYYSIVIIVRIENFACGKLLLMHRIWFWGFIIQCEFVFCIVCNIALVDAFWFGGYWVVPWGILKVLVPEIVCFVVKLDLEIDLVVFNINILVGEVI